MFLSWSKVSRIIINESQTYIKSSKKLKPLKTSTTSCKSLVRFLTLLKFAMVEIEI